MDHLLVAGMGLGEGGGEVEADVGWVGSADGGEGDRLCADGELVADGKAVRVADLDVGCADGRIGRERGAACLGADMCNRYGFNSVADAGDVEPDLVAGGDVGDGC